MKKILFLGAGSKSDPPFESSHYIEYLEDCGITITRPTVIESCHGCPDLMTKYSRQMQDLTDKGNRVVGVLAGGLCFALPNIQSTQVTYPIISCPLDFVSYQSFMTPSGNATMATVGIEGKTSNDEYENSQRINALDVAEKILNLEEDTVTIRGFKSKGLIKRLDDFGIGTSDYGKLVLAYSDEPFRIEKDRFQIWADPLLNAYKADTIVKSERILSQADSTVQVRSDQDLAIYAAKILSLRNPGIKRKITAMGLEKRKSYEERDLIAELGGK